MTPHPFDTAAPDYDREFTEPLLGRWYRDAVWSRVRRWFRPGDRILDLGCGTGEDAVFLARQGMRVRAVDVSEGMLEVARRKAEAAGVGERISFHLGDLAELEPDGEGPWDGALSDFGPLNCLEELEPVGRALARCLRPGAPALLVVMGPCCPWEIAWYLLRGRPREAFRRWRRGLQVPVGGGETVPVWYHSPGGLRRALAEGFVRRDLVGIGSLLPPPYLGGLVERAPRLFGLLTSLDRGLGRVFPFTRMNDHYLIALERRG